MSHLALNTENLFEFAKILGHQTDFKEVIRLVASTTAQILRADLALILMLNPDTRKTVNVIKLGHEILKDYGIPNRVPRYIPEGRIKSNLRVAEHLFQLDYMATYIHGWKQKAQALNRAANSVDRLSQDITTLSVEEMMNLGIEEWIVPEITTFLQTGSSELWQQLF